MPFVCVTGEREYARSKRKGVWLSSEDADGSVKQSAVLLEKNYEIE